VDHVLTRPSLSRTGVGNGVLDQASILKPEL
jgi:hypothetical protein